VPEADRGPPAYDAKSSSDSDSAARVYDGPVAVADGQLGWQAAVARRRDVNGPVGSPRTAFHGPVAHRHMDGALPPGSGMMAHRGFVWHS